MELDYFGIAAVAGYGVAARRNLAGLEQAGADVRWFPVALDACRRHCIVDAADGELGYPGHLALAPERSRDRSRSTIIHDLAEAIPNLRTFAHGEGLVACYTVWEAERLHPSWTPLLNQVDRVVVPCEWNARVFAASGVERPIIVVPHPIAETDPEDPPVSLPDDVFVFYTVSTWSPRKRVDLLVEAFCTEFDPDEPVMLFVKTPSLMEFSEHAGTRALVSTELAIQLARLPRGPAIVLDTNFWSDAQMAGLHQRGDAYVSLPHAEAWGIGAFDAAAAGRPVIITGYGGQLDYLGEDHPWLVDYELVSIDAPTMPTFNADNRWALPDVDHARSLMRSVYEDGDAANEFAGSRAEGIRTRFSQMAVGQGLIDALS